MAVTFSSVITNEAIAYSRAVSKKPGWHLIPKRFGISAYSGALDKTRDGNSMLTTWIDEPFSAVYSTDSNKLSNSIIISPNAYEYEINIGEVYFIYEDYYGNEFLFAIAQPNTPITFTPGTGQGYLFAFTLNNCNVADTFEIKYTYPQDIEDHNRDMKAHEELFANFKGLEVTYNPTTETLIFTANNS